jgi:RHS repeat-associated protein
VEAKSGRNAAHPQFTGKERDETGLDYFGARYYSGALGRFTSPDPKAESARLEDPQSWNRYGYTRNNPLKYVDPDGKDYQIVYNPKTNTATVTINIVLTGPGDNKQLASDWQKDTNAKIGGKHQASFGMTLDVKVNVTTDPESLPALGRNEMDVDSAHQKTELTATNKGTGTPTDLAEPNARTHETLHFGGLADQYDPKTNMPLKGQEGTMMGDPHNPNSQFTQQEIDQMGRNACNNSASCLKQNPEPKKPEVK